MAAGKYPQAIDNNARSPQACRPFRLYTMAHGLLRSGWLFSFPGVQSAMANPAYAFHVQMTPVPDLPIDLVPIGTARD
jgi:hypothetical protein